MKILLATIVATLPLLGAYAQYEIRGTVIDQNGDPLPAANVFLEGTDWATATDLDGKFMLSNVPGGDYTFKVSYVGYQTFTRPMALTGDMTLEVPLTESLFKGEEVIVYATRAHDKTPTTFSNVSRKEIDERNMGQDMPFVLGYTPSMVVTSDAGNGVGYTGMRIRGSDPTRINVTVNGIPLNDSESHGVFWVNMPDFASSVNNIQIQRGVGTSTNGAAAFGASVNLQTDMPAPEASAKLVNGYGSFNTWRHTLEFGTGLMDNNWSFEGRLSRIASDGYIDRAKSDLKSYYLAGGYYGEKTTVKALSFAGKEVTYQAWYGTPEPVLNGDEEGIQEVIDFSGEYDTQEQIDNLRSADRKYNYYLYDNEVDNYQQDHYQLHFNHLFSHQFNVSAALHYTYGRGYFEQYRYDEDLEEDYDLPYITLGDSTITTTDLIRRRWLDNHFYGFTFSANYSGTKWDLTLGGGWNNYDGDHFGEVIWAQYASTSDIRYRYYDNVGEKTDLNVYLKGNYQLTPQLNLFADAQVRKIDYHTTGIDSDLRPIDAGGDFFFFNPKVGFTYGLTERSQMYASFAIGNREPVRNDFIDAPQSQVPKHETLRNLEAGFRTRGDGYRFSANYYLMDYENQLVLTGELNDVGSSVRTNVPESYRMGVELVGEVELAEGLTWNANLTLSRNKIKDFTEVVYDFGEDFTEFHIVENQFSDTDISFSPNVIAGSQVSYRPVPQLGFSLFSKYVGKQYLDNTSNDDRSIDPYFVNDLKIDWTPDIGLGKATTLSLMVNNMFDVEYVANGYTWGYHYGEGNLFQHNNYYPQAGTNFLASVSITF